MSSPIKPWESGGSNSRFDRNVSSLSLQSTSKVPDVNIRANPAAPPPLPPRPSNVTFRRPNISQMPQVYRSYPNTGNYMGGYNSYGGYGNYGNYGLYNGMGYGGGQYPGYPLNANDPGNRLIALAEETSRPAFESIESFVRAFGSISFMLESTLGALHASFRAALGVADHLGQLRNILSAVSIFRLLQWIVRRVKMLFGAKDADGHLGSYWGEVSKAVEPTVGGDKPSILPSHWFLGAFVGFVMSGSYLAWKFLSHMASGPGGQLSSFKGEENEPWVQGKDSNCSLAHACHDFVATTEQELSFRAGEKLIIAPKSRQPYDVKDWLLAAHPWSPKHGGHPRIGLIPENYIRLIDRRSVRVHGQSQASYQSSNVPYSPYAPYQQPYPQPLQQTQHVYLPAEYPMNVDPNPNAVNRVPSMMQPTAFPSTMQPTSVPSTTQPTAIGPQQKEAEINKQPTVTSEKKTGEINDIERQSQSPLQNESNRKLDANQ